MKYASSVPVLLTCVYWLYLLPTSIFIYLFTCISPFASASNFDELASFNERAKIALKSCNRRKQLFEAAVKDHYEPHLKTIAIDWNRDEDGRDINIDRSKSDTNTKECIYYNVALEDESNVIMSYWTYEYCPRKHVRKLHLMPSHEWDIDTSTDIDTVPVPVPVPILTINSKKYNLLDGYTIGNYLDPLQMTQDSYNYKVSQIWGTAASTSTTAFNQLQSRSNNNTSTTKTITHYVDGDECKSFMSNIQLKRAVTMEMHPSCCPWMGSKSNNKADDAQFSSADTNYFSHQYTNEGIAILQVDQKQRCKYEIILCSMFCPNTTTTFPKNKKSTSTTTTKNNLQFANSISDLYLHQPDQQQNIPNHQNTTTTTTTTAATTIPQPQAPYESYWEELRNTSPKAFPPMPQSRKKSNLNLVQQMFQHAYDAYMYNAFPASELKSKSCTAGTFNLVRLPALTLIDSLDTLLIMGNYTEFARSVERLRVLDEHMKDDHVWSNSHTTGSNGNERGGLFAVDQNVSVFETNIRVLGGLLSAHQMATLWTENKIPLEDVFDEDGRKILIGTSTSTSSIEEDELERSFTNKDRSNTQKDFHDKMCTEKTFETESNFKDQTCPKERLAVENRTTSSNNNDNITQLLTNQYWSYDGLLLSLAHDIGKRLLPAFDSKTGIPYGTVNLLHGIPQGETPIASLAGGGTLSIEMELLSRYTGDESFGKAAKLAARAFWLCRSKDKSLMGKHINVQTGVWTETLSGIGSNSDSFYEYLLKHSILFPEDDDFFEMFRVTYAAINRGARIGDWYPDVDMHNGLGAATTVLESLAAFYPGNQVLIGELNPSTRSQNAFTAVREYLGFLPERFDFANWKPFHRHESHPLRPELHESCYFLHMATKYIGTNTNSSSSWLWSADFAIHELENVAKTNCGYGVVKSVKESETTTSAASSLEKDTLDWNHPKKKKRPLDDEMPSFFLSETLKYFFLAFDEDNPINTDKDRDWIFTTEAHPLYNIPPPLPDNNKDQSFDEIKQNVIKALKANLSTNNAENKKVENIAKIEPSLYRLLSESWSQLITAYRYSEELMHVHAANEIRNSFDLEYEEIYGIIAELSNSTTTSDSERYKDINFARIKHEKNGRGDRLSMSCPNYYHSNSLWIHALTGFQIDYTDLFVTNFYNDNQDYFFESIAKESMSALTSTAVMGLSSISSCDAANQCRKSKSKQDKYHKYYNAMPPGTRRLDMGNIGKFDITVFNGEGFFIKHVESGESIDATMIDIDNPTQTDAFVAIEGIVPVTDDKRNMKNRFDTKPLGSSFIRLDSIYEKQMNIHKPSEKIYEYDRNVIISDMKGNSFTCQVEVIQEFLQTDRNITIGSYPCLSAIFGPTNLKFLSETKGRSYEAVLRGPSRVDPFGCDTVINPSSLNSNQRRIELVRRGKCNFRDKGINLSQRNDVEAVIVINTQGDKLFVMAGPDEVGVDYSNEPAAVLVTKEDGDKMIDTINMKIPNDEDEFKIVARINLQDQSESMHDSWPIVTTEPDSVQMLASQRWGVRAQKDQQGQWSIVILQHDVGSKE